MDRESMRRLMDLIDDSDIKETMNRVSDNLDRVERMKAQRKNPDAQKTRAREICSAAASLPVPLPDTGMVSPAGSAVSKGAPLPAALILTGGGAKASFQAGACKILEENGLFDRGQIAVSSSINARLYLTKSVGCSITYPCRLACTDVIGSPCNLKISAIAGTSAGALNAAMLAGSDATVTEALWNSVEEARMQGKEGFFSSSLENDQYLEELIRGSGVLPRITPDSLLAVVTAFDYEKAFPKDFILNTMTEEEKVNCLLASSAFPIALRERMVRGTRYIDGGIPLFGSNMPIAPLYYLGYRRFIVIHCSSKERASEWTVMAKANLMFNQEEHFNGASFVHIFPRKDLGGLLDGTINFNHDYILNTIAQGISDMKESMNDLNILFEEIGEYDELHVADGERCRSYIELIDR